MAGCLAALDAVGALLVYWTARDLSGRAAGLAAALLYATSPAAVFYSRMIWNPQLVPFFGAAAVWGTVGFARWGDSRRLAVGLFAVGCAAQLHPSASVLLLPLVAAAGVGRRRPDWRPLAVGAAALGVLLAPYVALQLQSGWADLQAALAYAASPKDMRPEVGFVAASLLGGGFHRQIATWAQPLPDWSLTLEPGVWLALGLLAVGVGRALRVGHGWLPVVAFILPLLMGARSGSGVFPHYLLAIVPAAAIVAGVGAAYLRARLLVTVMLAVVSLRAADFGLFIASAAAAELNWPYGMPLRFKQAAVETGLAAAHGGRLIIGDHDIEAFALTALVRGRTRATPFDSANTLVLDPRGATYAVPSHSRAAAELRQAFGPPAYEVRNARAEPVFAIHSVSEEAVDAYLSRAAPPELVDVTLGAQARLRRLSPPPLQAGAQAPVLLTWEVLDPSPPSWPETRLFVHLVDQDGRQWSTSSDSYAAVVGNWARGDLVLFWQPLQVRADAPLGGYWLEAGFYLFGPNGPQPLPARQGGRDLGPRVRVGPLRVAGPSPPPPDLPLATFGQGEIWLGSWRREGDRVVLTWQARGRPNQDYTVFVHALDADGRIVAQHDSPPRDGSFPTRLWEPGDVVEDVHVLSGDLSAAVRLQVGLYRADSLERLPVLRPGSGPSDRLELPITSDGETASEKPDRERRPAVRDPAGGPL